MDGRGFSEAARLRSLTVALDGEKRSASAVCATGSTHFLWQRASMGEETAEESDVRHQEFLGSSPSPRYSSSETNARSLNRTWGRQGSWQVRSVPPWFGGETAGVQRAVELLPGSGISGMELLQQWGVGAFSAKGYNMQAQVDRKALCQDNFSFSQLTSGWHVFCVCDGHGTTGSWVASRATQVLPHILQCAKCDVLLRHRRVGDALTHAFTKTQEDLVSHAHAEQVNIQFSGSTAAVVMRHPTEDCLYVGTCGDTRVALLVRGVGVVQETVDHHPELQEDRQRIEAAGGEIRAVGPPGHTVDRVYVMDRNFPGLMMTRGLGDLVAKSIGVTEEPVVVKWQLESPNDSYLLMASDGVWEFIDTRHAAEIVFGALDGGATCQEAVGMLTDKSSELWGSQEGGMYCDDITAMLLPLAGVKPPKVVARPSTLGCAACAEMCVVQ